MPVCAGTRPAPRMVRQAHKSMRMSIHMPECISIQASRMLLDCLHMCARGFVLANPGGSGAAEGSGRDKDDVSCEGDKDCHGGYEAQAS